MTLCTGKEALARDDCLLSSLRSSLSELWLWAEPSLRRSKKFYRNDSLPSSHNRGLRTSEGLRLGVHDNFVELFFMELRWEVFSRRTPLDLKVWLVFRVELSETFKRYTNCVFWSENDFEFGSLVV